MLSAPIFRFITRCFYVSKEVTTFSRDRYLMTLISSYLWKYITEQINVFYHRTVVARRCYDRIARRRRRCQLLSLSSFSISHDSANAKIGTLKLNREEDWIGETNNTRSRLVTGSACAHHQAPPVVCIHPCRLPLLANLQNAHWLYNPSTQPTFPAVFFIILTKIMLLQVFFTIYYNANYSFISI